MSFLSKLFTREPKAINLPEPEPEPKLVSPYMTYEGTMNMLHGDHIQKECFIEDEGKQYHYQYTGEWWNPKFDYFPQPSEVQKLKLDYLRISGQVYQEPKDEVVGTVEDGSNSYEFIKTWGKGVCGRHVPIYRFNPEPENKVVAARLKWLYEKKKEEAMLDNPVGQ